MSDVGAAPRPPMVEVGDNATPIWGMSARERLRRIAAANHLPFDVAADSGPVILADLAFAFDPAWVPFLLARPGTAVTRDGRAMLAYVTTGEQRDAASRAMMDGAPWRGAGMTSVSAEHEGIFNETLRKREKPFAEPLTPATVPLIERESYRGAYKGVTDLLTLYLWPTWAFQLTRLAARLGISPNQVTALGTVLCVVATILFWHGWFWTGIAVGLVFMVLDTVDGKLARCTITSSRLGNAWDHGVDLIHPPFWWWAWAEGCARVGHPLADRTFWWVMAALLVGYMAQRLIEGAFIARFGMHIHVWQRFDSRFRLVTARRNPNMVILFASLLVARPDWGIVAVALWTVVSLVVHLVRLLQAIALAHRGGTVRSWLA